MKPILAILVFVLGLSTTLHAANTAPTPTIISAAMRPGTTLMDVIYRVTDPDDATVRVRALAFINGTRSFANILRPVTFVEGTAANLGDSIPSNTNQVLTWNIGTDWGVGLGQVKFEILALDSAGLLPIDWITIPAASGQPALTISKDAPSTASVLNALFWLYANNDPGISLNDGVLAANAQSGAFNGIALASGGTVNTYATPFVFKRMNVDLPTLAERSYSISAARTGIISTTAWHAVNRPWGGISILVAWGATSSGLSTLPLDPLTAVGAGHYFALGIRSDGTVVSWGTGSATAQAGLSGVTAVAGGNGHSLALKADGTVVAWGSNTNGQTTIPAGLSGVTAISAGGYYNLALKSDGTVAAWGDNSSGQRTIPAGLSGITAISAGFNHCLALKSDGTVTGWGSNGENQATVPTGLSNVTAIAAGFSHSLALKSNGTVIGWGSNTSGQTTIPSGLTGVTAIAAGNKFSAALKSNGTVVMWGTGALSPSTGLGSGVTTPPAWLTNSSSITAGLDFMLAYTSKAL